MSNDGTQTTHEGKEAVQDAYMKSIGKRYSQGNNSPFSTGQLLDNLGWVGDGPRMQDVIEGKFLKTVHQMHALCVSKPKSSTKWDQKTL